MNATVEGDLRGTIVAAAAGDEVAFARIIAAHGDDMARVAYLVCGDVALSREAVQSAWALAWRKMRTLRDHDRLRAWLVAIAANEARQLVRGRRRRGVVEITVQAFDDERDAPRGEDPANGYVDLLAALTKLDPEDRQIIAMRYAIGLTSFEIAAATGRSAAGVRSRLARALDRLREDLRDD
jgi:RNA polymerase sigma-70 factor (ECF subfamily)